MKKILVLAFLLLGCWVGAHNRVSAAETPKLPLSFTENKGQVVDSKGNLRPDILYTAVNNGVSIYFRNNTVSYVFPQFQRNGDNVQISGLHRSDVEFIGANPNVTLLANDRSAGLSNFYLAHAPNGISGVQSFSKITYQNIYPNIDLVYYASNNNGSYLKYEFVVRPGGKVSDIKMRYSGVSGVEADRSGNIIARNALGNIVEEAPYTYQATANGKQEIASSYALKNGVVTFNIGNYDANQTLVIDPITRQFATNFGGSALDRAQSVTLDASGNTVIAGFTASTNFPVSVGALQSTLATGSNDAVVSSFTPTGTVNWSTYYGGSGLDQAFGITSDASGNVTVVGYTASTNFPVLSAAQPTASINGDAFAFRLTNTGTRVWSTYFGGDQNDRFSSVASFTNGDVAIVGQTFSNGLATPGSFQTAVAGRRDGLVVRMSASGTRLWSTYYGGIDEDRLNGVSVDNADNVVVAGVALSNGLSTSGSFQATNSGNNDALVVKFNGSGARQWATYYGGIATDIANAVTTDASGNIFVVGNTSSANFPTALAFQAAIGGATDAFLFALNGAGARLMGTYIGGSGTENGASVATVGGKVYVAGASNSISTSFPTANPAGVALPAGILANSGGFDMFLVKVTAATAARDWAFLYGATGDDVASGVAVSMSGNAVALAGYTNSGNFPTLNPVTPQTPAAVGNDDIAVVRFSETVEGLTVTATSRPACTGGTNGMITVTSPMMGAGVTYSITAGPVTRPAQASNMFNGLAAGTYTVSATSGGNTATASVVVANASVPTLTASGNTISCGANNGTVTATVAGGTGPFVFSLTGGQSSTPQAGTTFAFNGLMGGSYTVQVTDANGCTATAMAMVTQPGGFTVTAAKMDAAICNGVGPALNSGSIMVTAAPAGSYTYSLSGAAVRPAQTAASFTNLPAGNYVVTTTDPASGCNVMTNVTIGTVNTTVQIIGTSQTTIPCGGGTASLTVNAISSLDGLMYSLSGGAFQMSNTFTGVMAGSYTVVARDANGCSATGSVTVVGPTAINISAITSTVNCITGLGGGIMVNASGGTAPYLYSIRSEMGSPVFVGSPEFMNIPAGVYPVRIQDARGCVAGPVLIEVPSNGVSITNATAMDVTCGGRNDGSIMLTLNGGSLPYSLVVNGGMAEMLTSTTRTWTGLGAGTYSIVVTDMGGCRAMRDVVINEPMPITYTVTPVEPVGCNNANGSLTVNAMGGRGNLQFNVNGGMFMANGATVAGLAPGLYTINIRDNGGMMPSCTLSETFTLSNNTTPTLISAFAINPSCSFGTLNNNGQITVVATSAPMNLPIWFSIQDGAPGSWFASASGSYTFTGLTPGSYRVRVANGPMMPTAASCTVSGGIVTVSSPAPIRISSVTRLNPTCGVGGMGGSITINANGGTGGLLYSVDGGNTFSADNTVSGLYPNVNGYNVIIQDQNGCRLDGGNYRLFNPSGLSLPSNPIVVNPSCGQANGTITVFPVGGTLPRRYFLQPNSTGTPMLVATNSASSHIYNNIPEGSHRIRIEDANGCVVEQGVMVATLLIRSAVTNQPACAAAGNFTQTAIITSNISGGTGPFTYSITGQEFMMATAPLTDVTYVATLVPAPTNTNRTYTSVASTARSFTFPGPANTVAAPGYRPGVYVVTVTDLGAGSSCVIRDTVVIGTSTTNAPSILSVNKTDRTCNIATWNTASTNPGSVTTVASPAFGTGFGINRVLISSGTSSFEQAFAAADNTVRTSVIGNGSGGQTNLPAGNYRTFAFSANGCIAVGGRGNVTEPGRLVITNVSVTQPVCNGLADPNSGGRLQIVATGGRTLEYTLNAGAAVPAIAATASFQTNGLYVPAPTGTIAGNNIRIREVGTGTDCQAQWTPAITIANANGLTVTLGAITNSCATGATGTIAVTSAATTLRLPLSFVLNGTVAASNQFTTAFTFRNVPAGRHTVQVVDANGCVASAYAVVGSTAPFTLAVTSPVTPNGCTGGQIQIAPTPAGAVATPYRYSLNGGNTFSTNVTTANANFGNGTAIGTTAPTNANEFQLTAAQNTALTAGSYRVVVRDVNSGCEVSTNFTLTGTTPALTLNSIVATNSTCPGTSNASVVVSAVSTSAITIATGLTLGTTAIVPVVTNAATGVAIATTIAANTAFNATFNNVPAGNHDVVIINAGCAGDLIPPALNATVSVISSVNITSVTSTNPTCTMPTAGTVTVVASGQTGLTLEYSLDTDATAGNGEIYQTSNMFTNVLPQNPTLATDVYRVRVRYVGLSSCGATATATWGPTIKIMNTNQLGISAITSTGYTAAPAFPTNPTVFTTGCKGSSVRLPITVTWSSTVARAPYRVFLNNVLVTTTSTTTNIFNNLGEGSYTVRIEDADGCRDENTFTIVSSPIAVTSVLTNTTACGGINNGQIVATVTGGVGARTYTLISNGITGPTGVAAGTGAAATTITITNLAAGIHQLIIADVNNCRDTSVHVLIDGTSAIRVTGTTVVGNPNNGTCNNGFINLAVTGFSADNPVYEISSDRGTTWTTTQPFRLFPNLNVGTYYFRSRTGTNIANYCYSYFGPVTLGNCTPTRTGASASEALNNVTVYPNPNKGTFNVNILSNIAGEGTLQLVDLTGRTIISRSVAVDNGDNSYSLDIANQAAGVYILQVTNGASVTNIKVVKE
jgi:hypothetical protein